MVDIPYYYELIEPTSEINRKHEAFKAAVETYIIYRLQPFIATKLDLKKVNVAAKFYFEEFFNTVRIPPCFKVEAKQSEEDKSKVYLQLYDI